MPNHSPEKLAVELDMLVRQVARARAILTGLRKDIADAEVRMQKYDRANLMEVNERLIMAAMQSQTEADSAMQALSELARSAELDALTQLPNRALLQERFTQAIANAKRHRKRLGVLFIDVDHFKHINDTWGHPVGDEVLRQTARCLASVIRDVDTASRYGGDEFLILVTDMVDTIDAAGVADKVSAAMTIPMAIGQRILRLSVSIGWAVYPDDGNDPEALIQSADAAMYLTKRSTVRQLPTLR